MSDSPAVGAARHVAKESANPSASLDHKWLPVGQDFVSHVCFGSKADLGVRVRIPWADVRRRYEPRSCESHREVEQASYPTLGRSLVDAERSGADRADHTGSRSAAYWQKPHRASKLQANAAVAMTDRARLALAACCERVSESIRESRSQVAACRTGFSNVCFGWKADIISRLSG